MENQDPLSSVTPEPTPYQSVSPETNPTPPPSPSPRNFKKWLLIGVPSLVVLLGAGLAYGHSRGLIFSSEEPEATPSSSDTPTPSSSPDSSPTTSSTSSPSTKATTTPKTSSKTPTPTATATPTTVEELLSYSNTTQGYSFKYLKTWKTGTFGSLTAVASPETQNSEIYQSGSLLYYDALVSSTPYYTGEVETYPGVTVTGVPTPKSYLEQAKDLAIQINPSVTDITVGGLKGYAAISKMEGVTVYNIVLAGSKTSFLLQFKDKETVASFSTGQKAILDSFKEL